MQRTLLAFAVFSMGFATGCAETDDDFAELLEAAENVDIEQQMVPFLVDSTWCYTLVPDGPEVALMQYGMDTGFVSEVGRFDQPNADFVTNGLARRGNVFIAAVDTGNSIQWFGMDIANQFSAWGSDTQDTTVTASPGYWITASNNLLFVDGFRSLGRLVNDNPNINGPLIFSDHRPTVGGGELYTAPAATSLVEARDFNGLVNRVVDLDGFDGFVRGISYANGWIHLLDDGSQVGNQRILKHDSSTGSLVSAIPIDGTGGDAYGLWCEGF